MFYTIFVNIHLDSCHTWCSKDKEATGKWVGASSCNSVMVILLQSSLQFLGTNIPTAPSGLYVSTGWWILKKGKQRTNFILWDLKLFAVVHNIGFFHSLPKMWTQGASEEHQETVFPPSPTSPCNRCLSIRNVLHLRNISEYKYIVSECLILREIAHFFIFFEKTPWNFSLKPDDFISKSHSI